MAGGVWKDYLYNQLPLFVYIKQEGQKGIEVVLMDKEFLTKVLTDKKVSGRY